MRELMVRRLRGSVILNVGLTVVALVFSGMVVFGFNLAVGRVYGSSELGTISVVVGLAFFLSQVSSTVGLAATKFMAEALGRGDADEARTVFQFLFVLNAVLAGLLAAGLVAAAPWVEAGLHVGFRSVLLGAALVFAYALYLFFKAVYYGIHQVSAYVRNEIISDVAFFVLLAAVFVAGIPAWLLVPFVLNNVIFAGIAGRDLLPYFRQFDWLGPIPRSAILRYWMVNGSGSAASVGRYSLGTTIAGLFLSHHAVGLYAAAASLVSPLLLMPRALSLVLFATMARLHGAGRAASLGSLLRLSTDWLVVVPGLLCGLLIVNASMVLRVLFRPEYVQATVATQLAVLGAYLLMISSPSINALTSTIHVRITMIGSFVGLAVSLALWLALVPRVGINGAALGLAAGSAVTGGIPAFFACRLVGLKYSVFLRAGGIIAALALVIPFASNAPLAASIAFVGLVAVLYVQPTRAAARQALRTLRTR